MLLEPFRRYLDAQGLCGPTDRILLAVSGGIDSSVLAHLFLRTEVDCAIAHCNFQLRNQESEGDEAFVRSLAASYDIPVFTEHFDTTTYAEESGISIQMAARELRYRWFNELIDRTGYTRVATAHNSNDSIETLLLNLVRGTGLKGLTGIPPVNGAVIRPLLFASRREIAEYARQHEISYREDSSNKTTKYTRNRIRHTVIPVLEEINENFVETMKENIDRMSETYTIFKQAVDTFREQVFKPVDDRILIEISTLTSLTPRKTWLYELFSPFHFTRSQCEGIGNMLDAGSGKHSVSTTHHLYKDRDHLILLKSGQKQFDRYYIDGPERNAVLPFPLDMEVLGREDLGSIPSDESIACLDFDRIQFPLMVRHWLHGDYFCPLGMDQMKKLSDFFVDCKIPVPLKDKLWILASGRKIVWIVGMRIDNRFKITEKTTRILKLSLQSDILS